MSEATSMLHVTARIVALHKYRAMERFQLKNNADLIRFVIGQRETLSNSSE